MICPNKKIYIVYKIIVVIGRVYKIIPNEGNEIYIGSTIQQVKSRFQDHKNKYLLYKAGKKVGIPSSIYLFDKYGVDKCAWQLIKEYEVVDKTHLKAYEQLWINKLKSSINQKSSFDILCGKCAHGRYKHRCVECSGSQVCSHYKDKRNCKICSRYDIIK